MHSRLLILSLMLAILLSCGRSEPRQDGAANLPQVTVSKAQFRDSDPQDFPGKDPDRHPVHGIDVSRYQGNVDWRAAQQSGVSFAFLKATEGGDGLDPSFAANWRGAAAAGIPRGAFHFFYFCRPASEQARWFIKHVPRSAGALPPVLDMEWTPFSPTCTIRPDAATVRAEAEVFLNILERHYGQRPLIYSTPEFNATNQMWRIPRAEFWLRAVADHPSNIYPGQPWTFWQYSSTGGVGGIRGHTDLNAFAGSKSDWASWLAARML